MDIETRAKKIAVVEDDEPIRDAVQIVLENQGWEIIAYANGEDFVSSFADHKFNCLILDPHLPGINAVQVLEQLDRGNLPVIILTANPNSPQISLLQKQGVAAVLLKPITENVLIKNIQECLS